MPPNRATPNVAGATRNVATDSIRTLLKLTAWTALAKVSVEPRRQLVAVARNKVAVVTVALQSRIEHDRNAAPMQQFPGFHFSPIEAAIWNALVGAPLAGKAIARAIGQKYTPKLRTILHNLVEREAIKMDRSAGGYARVSMNRVA